MVVDRFIFKNYQITFLFTLIPETNVGLPKPSTVKSYPCFRFEVKTGEEPNLIIFKDTPMNIHVNGELSTGPFH